MAKKKKKKNVTKKKQTGKKNLKKKTGVKAKRKKGTKKQPKKQGKKQPIKAAKKVAKKAVEKKKVKKKTRPDLFKEKFKGKFAKELRKPLIVIFAILGLVVIWNLASLVITYSLLGKALPGTRIAGIEVGGNKLDQIQNKLMEKGQPYLESSIPVTLGEQTENFLPKELGISLLPRNTIQEIHFVSFGDTGLYDVLAGLWSGHEIPFYVSVDVLTAQKNIEERFGFEDKKAKNAYLAFEEGILKIFPGKAGEVFDIRKLYLEIKESANSLSVNPIEVETFEQMPIVTEADLQEEMEEIEEILYKNISLVYDNWSWDIKLINHIDWVSFTYKNELKIGDVLNIPLILEEDNYNLPEPVSIEKSLWVDINEEPFLAYVESEISPSIEVKPEEVNIYRDEKGEIVIEGKGEDGQKIIDKFLLNGIALAANYDVNEVTIPVQIEKVEVNVSGDLQMLGIETLIGTGRSAFAGSPPNRIHNIGVGVNRFNGTLVAPDETFSFNENLGPVDASTGYLPELVIKAEGTIPEYGGGLCQVSTTLYRAALFSGLPIIERSPHSYAVSYYAQIYGYGLDATIYIGVRDVKFLNDTEGHILIQAYTEGNRAFFKFYGTDDGRNVELEGPYIGGWRSPGPPVIVETPTLPPGARRQVEIAHTGFNATWYRYLTKDGETVKEPIYSNYRAIPAKILVGPSADSSEEVGG